MAEKAKNLRKIMSKQKVSSTIKEPEIQKEESKMTLIESIPEYEVPVDIDPLNFIDQQKIEIKKVEMTDPLKYLDSLIEDKKEKECDQENNKAPRLLGSLNNKNETMSFIKMLQLESEKYDTVDLPKLDEGKKKRLMERMTSAREGISKMTFGKALLKRASAAVTQKEGDSYNQLNQILSDDLAKEKSAIFMKDNDVQQVQEGQQINTDIKVKEVDFTAFMIPPAEGKKKKNIAQILLKNKKKKENVIPEDTKPKDA